MSDIQNIELSLGGNTLLFISGIIFIIIFSIYIYRYTLPKVSSIRRFVLISLRALALLLILFLFFEPTLTITRNKIFEPAFNLFVDNSTSITEQDSAQKISHINDFISGLKNIPGLKLDVFRFSETLESITENDSIYLDFSGRATNFAGISSLVQSTHSDEQAAAIILSDGIFTSGANPVTGLADSPVPVFTVGIGEKTQSSDSRISNLIHNKYFYANEESDIKVIVENNYYSGRTVSLNLFENNKLVERKQVTLSESGSDIINFSYLPSTPGEKRMRVSLDNIAGEKNIVNNRKDFFVTVLKNKQNILLFSGSVSADYSFIKNVFIGGNKFNLNEQVTITKTGSNNWPGLKEKLEKTDAVFFIGYPSESTSLSEISNVKQLLKNNNTPLFVTLSPGVSSEKLQLFNEFLPLSSFEFDDSYYAIQPEVGVNAHPIIKNRIPDFLNRWQKLPPIFQRDFSYRQKPESSIIVGTRLDNQPADKPLVLINNNNHKSLIVLAGGIWKWKLNPGEDGTNLFENFLLNSVKWLTSNEALDRIIIRPGKKIFYAGEEIEFRAEVYDDTFTPVDNADVGIKIQSGEMGLETVLESLGNGLYSGKFNSARPGVYSFDGRVKIAEEQIGKVSGNFVVEEFEAEKLNLVMDQALLQEIAVSTGALYYDIKDADALSSKLMDLKERNSRSVTELEEIDLWPKQGLLIFIIIFLTLEWIIRKQSGML